jgi:hypothetical protein
MNINLGPYAKFLTAAAGLAVTLLTQKYGATAGGATWLPYVVGIASALGVYGVPNTPKMLTVKGEAVSTPSGLNLSNQLTDAEVAEIRAKFEQLYPVKTPPAPIQSQGTMQLPGLQIMQQPPESDTETSSTQAGSLPAATEGLPKG